MKIMAHASSHQPAIIINSSLIHSPAASNLCLINPQSTLIHPQLSLITPPFLYPASRLKKPARDRSSIARKLQAAPHLVSASSSKSDSLQTSQRRSPSSSDNQSGGDHRQLLHHLSLRMVLEIITFIWRLPGMITRFLKKEDKLMDTIEDDINETANAVQLGSKVVEGLAEGIEKVAEAIDNKDLEKMAKMVEEDAKKVDKIMDKVKARTKVVHDELEEVAGSLGETMQGGEGGCKRDIKIEEVSLEETTKSSTVSEVSSMLATSTKSNVDTQTGHHALLGNLMKLQQAKRFTAYGYGIASSVQPFLANLDFEIPLVFFTSLKALIIVAFLMLKKDIWLTCTKVATLSVRVKSLKVGVSKALGRGDVRKFCPGIINIHNHGLFDGKKALWKFLMDISQNTGRDAQDDINDAASASAVQLGSKVVEGLVEGIEKVTEAKDNMDLEKMADMVEEDPKKVDKIMDKVKARTKVVHDELEKVAGSFGETMQGVVKVVAKRRIKIKEDS
ncbi:hypothetical protein L7F22_045901 [Adiantum nelumboides]|nr:hypothetical protein [Adiantum nelumboides]